MGYPANVMVGNFGAQAPMSGYPQTPSTAVPSTSPGGKSIGAGTAIIDGTPMRVATLVILAVGGLVALKFSGFKFNVTAG